MRRFGFAVLALLVVLPCERAGAEGASYYDGTELRKVCNSSGKSPQMLFCMGYVMGISDAAGVAVGDVKPRPDGTIEEALGVFRWCIPQQHAEPYRLGAIVSKWLAAHPEHLHYAAGSLVAGALADAFPCK